MRKSLFILVCCTIAAGCGSNTSPASMLPADLVASWYANSTCSPACSYTLTSVSNPMAHSDLVATAGLTVDLVLRPDGSAVLSILGQTETGTARVSGSTLILAGSSTDTIDYQVTATSLDLRFRQPVIYDLNLDGRPDTTVAHAVLKKR